MRIRVDEDDLIARRPVETLLIQWGNDVVLCMGGR